MIAMAQPIEQALLAADPAYQAWSAERQQEGEMDFDEWLLSPAGQDWLKEEAARDRLARNGYHDLEPWDFEAIGE